MKMGEWILRNHQVPTLDPLTYRASTREYLDIHWLYQVALYLAFYLGGYGFLSFLNAVCALSLVWITWKRLRLVEIPTWTSLVILVVILFGIEIRFRARPEMLSCLLMSLVFWILEMKERKGRDLGVFLPLLFALWANVEGLFAVGWVILGIYLLADLIEGGKYVTYPKKYYLLAILVCTINPYFIRGFFFPFTLLKSLSSGTFQTIQEFRSPWLLGEQLFATSPAYLLIYKVFSLTLGGMVLLTLKKRNGREWGVFLAFFILSAFSWRNIELFLLACAPLAAACWKDLEWKSLGRISSRFDRACTAWVISGLLIAISLRVLTSAYYVDSRRPDRFGLGIRQDCVAPGHYLIQNHLEGRILNTNRMGGWLEWEWGNKTFSDGRLEVMGEELYREEAASFQPGGLLRLVEEYHPDILAFSPLDDRAWFGDLKFMLDWRPVHLDGNTVIYLRRGYGDQVPGLILPELEREWGISPDLPGQIRTTISSLATDGELSSFLEGFWRRPIDPRELKSAAYFCAITGHLDDAMKFDLEAIRLCRGRFKDYYEQLWEISQDAHQKDLSDWCYKHLKG